jgi:hypothetical protein
MAEPKLTVAPEPIRWRKLQQPQFWRPSNAGEELAGYYLGRTLKDGAHGQYYVVLVAVPGEDGTTPYMASGSALIRAIDGGQVEVGSFIKIEFHGWKALSGDRMMKLFDVFVGEGMITPDQARAYLNGVFDDEGEEEEE